MAEEVTSETRLAGEQRGCDGCALGQTRRDFVREAASGALAAFALLGLSGRVAGELPIRFSRALSALGATLSYAIPAQDGAEIDKDNEVILVRWQNAVYAFNLSCPHQRTALRWNAQDGRFQCPKHHSQYTPDGHFITGRATRGMDRFPLQKNGNAIAVDVSSMIKQTENAVGWDAAVVHLS